MWAIDICFKYSNIITHLAYDTKEEAEAQRDKLIPVMGKEREYDRNSKNENVILTDKFGTVVVVPSEVKALRCFDVDAWEEMAIENTNARTTKLIKAP